MVRLNSDETNVPSHIRDKLSQFCDKLQDVLGDTLVSVVLYGPTTKGQTSVANGPPVNIMLVLRDVTTGLLDRIAALVRKGARDFRLSVMILSKDDLQRSTDVFPVKFLDMQQSHVVLCGEDVLEDLLIGGENLRLRCEQEARNTLVRLRNLYLHRANDPKQVQTTISSAVSSLLRTLNAFLFLVDGSWRHAEDDIVAAATKLLRLDTDVLPRLLAVTEEQHGLGASELKNLFDVLLSLAQRIADVIDRFEQSDT